MPRHGLNRGFSFILLSLLAAVYCDGVLAEGKVLRWKFQQGDHFHVVLTQSSVHETRVNNRPLKMTVAMTTELDWKIASVDEQGRGVMTQSFTRMALKMDNDQGQSLDFDSASESKPRGLAQGVAERIKPLIGLQIQLTMTDRGEIVEVALSDKAQSAISDAAKDARFKDLFSKEGLTQMLRQSAIVLPEKAVAEGDSWTTKTSANSPVGVLDQTHEFTYGSTEERDGRSLEKMTVQTSLDIRKAKSSSEPKLKLSDQSQTGDFYFDSESGNFVESTIKQKLTSETPYRDLLIHATVDSSMSMTIKRVTAP